MMRRITSFTGGTFDDKGETATLHATTEDGPVELQVSMFAMQQMPLLALQVLPIGEKRAAGDKRGFMSYPASEVHIGEDKLSEDLLCLLTLHETGRPIAFQLPQGCLEQLVDEVRAIQRRRALPPQGRPDN